MSRKRRNSNDRVGRQSFSVREQLIGKLGVEGYDALYTQLMKLARDERWGRAAARARTRKPRKGVRVAMTAYHVTPTRRVGAIRRHGLIPRDPGRNPHGFTWWGAKNHGVEAVYLLTDRRSAEDWRGSYDVPTAVLEVDITGYRVQPDAYASTTLADDQPLRRAIRITDRIPPERVRRVV